MTRNSAASHINPERAAFVSGAIAAITAFLVYLPALGNGFVNWDDQVYIYESQIIQNLDWDFIRLIFTTSLVSNWHPLTMLSYAIDYKLWGLDPWGYHLENVVLHAVNTFLTALVAHRLAMKVFGKERGVPAFFTGLITALLFGLHPLHVESVAWVSERKDVLSGFFFLLSIFTYIKYAEGSKRGLYYSVTVISFVLALLSKPMAITLPAVLLIMDIYPLGRLGPGTSGIKRVFLEKIPFFALSAASAVLTVWAQKTALQSIDMIPFGARVSTAIRAYAFYLYKTVFPVGLAPFYPHPIRLDFFYYQYWGSLVLLLLITGLCLIFYKQYKILLAVWLYYLVTLLPVSGIVQVGMQSAADRYMYIPSLGPFILMGALAGSALRPSRKGALAAVLAITVIASAAMSLKTVSQTGIWKDSVTFWTYEIDYLGGGSAREEVIKVKEEHFQTVPPIVLAYYKRGIAYSRKKDYAQAIADLSRAIELNPDYADAYIQRGTAYGRSGDNERALEDLDFAISLRPNYALAYNNRGVAYKLLGDYENARKDFEMAEYLKRRGGE